MRTVRPASASATAVVQAIVVLPTPPLPEKKRNSVTVYRSFRGTRRVRVVRRQRVRARSSSSVGYAPVLTMRPRTTVIGRTSSWRARMSRVDIAVAHEGLRVGRHLVPRDGDRLELDGEDRLAQIDKRRVEDRAAQSGRTAERRVEDLDVYRGGGSVGSVTRPVPLRARRARHGESLGDGAFDGGELELAAEEWSTPSMSDDRRRGAVGDEGLDFGVAVTSGVKRSTYSNRHGGPESLVRAARTSTPAAARQVFSGAHAAIGGRPTITTWQLMRAGSPKRPIAERLACAARARSRCRCTRRCSVGRGEKRSSAARSAARASRSSE